MKNINLVQKDDYDKVVIQVGSRCGKGKSTIIYLIKQMLDEYGFTVEFDGGLDHSTEVLFDNDVSKNILEKMDAVKNNTTIKLNEVQFALNLMDNE